MRNPVIPMIVGSALGVGVVYATAFLPAGSPAWAPCLMVVSIATMLVATMMLGAARDGRTGRLAATFVLVWLILVVGFGLALSLPAETAADPRLLFGLPLRTAIVLYGIGLVPLFFVPIAYAFTFNSLTLSDDDLEKLRGAAKIILEAEQKSPVSDDAVYAESAR